MNSNEVLVLYLFDKRSVPSSATYAPCGRLTIEHMPYEWWHRPSVCLFVGSEARASFCVHDANGGKFLKASSPEIIDSVFDGTIYEIGRDDTVLLFRYDDGGWVLQIIGMVGRSMYVQSYRMGAIPDPIWNKYSSSLRSILPSEEPHHGVEYGDDQSLEKIRKEVNDRGVKAAVILGDLQSRILSLNQFRAPVR